MSTQKRREKAHRIASLRQAHVVVVLEDIQDPHNAAAVLRSCDAFGIQTVSFIFHQEAAYDPKKIGKVSSSSANKWLSLDVYSSTEKCIDSLKDSGYSLVSTALTPSATSLFDMTFDATPVALIFGNETRGISDTMRAASDMHVMIPMRGMVQSLNVSVAAGIVLFEMTRQRLQKHVLYALSNSDQSTLVNAWLDR